MGLLVLVLPLLALSVFDLIRRPTIRRLALRNVVRRKGEALLVIVGSLLGTAIITGAFIVGDTLGASIRDFARTELGPVDEVVRVPDPAKKDALTAALSSPIEGVDGVLPMLQATASVASIGDNRRAEPSAPLLELDFDQARKFGGDLNDTGMGDAGATPIGTEVVIGEELAKEIDVDKGDRVEVFAYGQTQTYTIRQVLDRVGVAGYGFGSRNVFVPAGTLSGLAARSTLRDAIPPDAVVLVSNTGGVFDGEKLTAAVKPRLERAVSGVAGASVQSEKQRLLEDADAAGTQFRTLFGGIGSFSVIAGILLLVNIFVMLSEERKSELGMLRAVGLKRNQLVRSFGLEGGVYAVVSSIVGAFVGVGLGRVVVEAAQSVFNGPADEFQLSLRFTANGSSIVTGLAIGLVISLITVWGTSARIGRLNVIQAIRDIQTSPLRRVRRRSVVMAGVGVAVGVILFLGALGADADGWFGAMAGIPIAAFCSIPLLSRWLPRRAVVTVACSVALVWPIICFSVLPDAFETVDIPGFVVQGVLLVAAAVSLLAVNADILIKSTNWLSASGRTLSARLAFAYPLARRFRTAMLLAMYSLIIFTMTFLAVFSNLFSQTAPKLAAEVSAGYDVLVMSNFTNPVPAAELAKQPDVVALAPFVRAFPYFSNADHPEPEPFPLSGVDASLLARGVPTLGDRDARFASDRDAWETVLRSPDLAFVSDFFLQDQGGPPEGNYDPGDKFTVYNRTTGQERVITVAGVVTNDFIGNGVFMSADTVRAFMGPEAVVSRYYVAVRDGADPAVVATRLNGAFIPNGVDADAIDELVSQMLEQQEGFFRLMEGYLGLGLVIGIAGLGVVMVRAVRERRRQIGMLRAMGFQHGVVRRAFILEAAFIAFQGIIVGVVLALITSYQLLTNGDSFGEQQLDYSVPWLVLGAVLVSTMVASLLAVLGPAAQASRIKPAVALRIAD